jgi:hypothetical protein
MRPVILFRAGTLHEEKELSIAEKHFPVIRNRVRAVADDLVIGRYSVLPEYKELENDIEFLGAKLINSYKQHRYVADLRNWVEDPFLRQITPKTWYRVEDVPDDEPGPFVVKGSTNSRKHDWKTHMFAKDKRAASEVAWRLYQDGLIGEDRQSIYVRKFVPFKRLMTGINDLPITVEFRFFVAFGEVLCGAYYWSSYADDLPDGLPKIDCIPVGFVEKIAAHLKDKINFVVVDVGIDESGLPWIVELNDGQMSGESENDLDTLYRRLHEVVSSQ